MDTTKIEEKSEELLLGAIDFIERSGQFVAEQAPLVVQEFLTWRSIRAASIALAIFLIWLVVAAFSAWSVRRFLKMDASKVKDFDCALAAIPCMVLLFGSLVAMPAFVIHVMEFVQIQVAPRVYLIEELPKLIKD